LLQRKSALAGSFILILALAAPARDNGAGCATGRGGAQAALAEHRSARRLRAIRPLAGAPAATSTAYDRGQIAVLDHSGGVLVEPNVFSLSNRSLVFTPAGSGYTYAATAAAWDTTSGDSLSGLGDDDARLVRLPFTFPFYGHGYASVYVQSDGNLSFTTSDAVSTARTLGRMAAGPPRLAPLFTDLDPTQSGGEVRVSSAADRVVVTWSAVRLFNDYGAGAPQTFQVTLYPSGRIAYTYGTITASDAVVGISPGGLAGEVDLVTFNDSSTSIYASTLAERFATTSSIDIVRVAQRFYETHQDAYDYLVIFNTEGIPAASGALAYETTVRSITQGIGDTAIDIGSTFGSARRLQAVLNMGPLSQYPADPNAVVGSRGLITGDTTLTLLGHEAGHRFLALASVRDPSNPDARPMLGTQLSHWSFNFNSEASLLEGNRIADLGAERAPRFLTTATVEGYSPLDQYLMGLREPGEVPATFLVQGTRYANSSFPRVGVPLSGTRRDIALDELIAAEGRRVPDASVSQRLFRFAFILVGPASSEIAQLETYRAAFEPYFHQAAGERAWADATLRQALNVSLWPATGAVAGWPVAATVSIARPRQTDLSIRMIGASAKATIPAGSTTASFTFTPTTAGTADLYVIPSDLAFEVIHARLDAKSSRAELRLELYYQEPGLTVLRVSDVNEIPYSNIPVLLSNRDSALNSDERGFIWIWRTDTTAFDARIEGVAASSIAVP
jgi:hypothetical protein